MNLFVEKTNTMNKPVAQICYNGDLFEIDMDGSDYYVITNEIYHKIDPTQTIGNTLYELLGCMELTIDSLHFMLDSGKSVQAVEEERKGFLTWTWVETPAPFQLSLL